MLDYYGKHRMVERIEDLYQRHQQMPREDLRAALISWDNDQGRSMESSERLLKRPPQKCQWSPALRNSAILRRYWMLRLRELLHGKNFQSTFIRWQTQVQQSDPQFLLPSLGTRLSVDQIRHELTQANNRFRRLQKISIPLRLQCYEDLLDTYLEDKNPATQASSRRKAKIVLNTISGETTRTTFGHIRRITKPSERSSLSKVLVPPSSMAHESGYSAYHITQEHTDIPWETVFTREELEQHILDYNKESFRAASESPCGHGIIHDALTFTSLSPQSEDLLSESYLRSGMAPTTIFVNFWPHLSFPCTRTHGDIPTGISSDDVIRGFKGWKEQTSTSPSGRHLGHYRALIQDPILLKCFVYFMNIVVTRGIAIPRWCRATNVMIEKDAGKPCIHRLRIVHLFEADYNFF
ncbi:hypothetical protein MHU86_20115 [Fragilaria crotonensis]|nr:hypothetical protein MHU86_20115 [Fragilaria crotonensis]